MITPSVLRCRGTGPGIVRKVTDMVGHEGASEAASPSGRHTRIIARTVILTLGSYLCVASLLAFELVASGHLAPARVVCAMCMIKFDCSFVRELLFSYDRALVGNHISFDIPYFRYARATETAREEPVCRSTIPCIGPLRSLVSSNCPAWSLLRADYYSVIGLFGRAWFVCGSLVARMMR